MRITVVGAILLLIAVVVVAMFGWVAHEDFFARHRTVAMCAVP